jgi:hypothetical protein
MDLLKTCTTDCECAKHYRCRCAALAEGQSRRILMEGSMTRDEGGSTTPTMLGYGQSIYDQESSEGQGSVRALNHRQLKKTKTEKCRPVSCELNQASVCVAG